jgi:hypothetical protein
MSVKPGGAIAFGVDEIPRGEGQGIEIASYFSGRSSYNS